MSLGNCSMDVISEVYLDFRLLIAYALPFGYKLLFISNLLSSMSQWMQHAADCSVLSEWGFFVDLSYDLCSYLLGSHN